MIYYSKILKIVIYPNFDCVKNTIRSDDLLYLRSELGLLILYLFINIQKPFFIVKL